VNKIKFTIIIIIILIIEMIGNGAIRLINKLALGIGKPNVINSGKGCLISLSNGYKNLPDPPKEKGT
jgi:hypothetical protein